MISGHLTFWSYLICTFASTAVPFRLRDRQNDNNGVSRLLAVKVAWGAQGIQLPNDSIDSSFGKVQQSLTVPIAGKYLVTSNLRIRDQSAAQAFVKAELTWTTGSSTGTTEPRMIEENVGYDARGFNNYGGWVLLLSRVTAVHFFLY